MPDISQEKLEAVNQDIKALCDKHNVDLQIIQKHEILVKEREPKTAPAQPEPKSDDQAQ